MLVKRKSRPRPVVVAAQIPARCSCGRCKRCRRRLATARWRRLSEQRRRSLDALWAYLTDLSQGERAAEGWSHARTDGVIAARSAEMAHESAEVWDLLRVV